MAATVRETMLEMLASTVETMQLLLSAGDDCLELPSSHVCAHGKDTWTLLTNLIDHETEHTGQLAQARYEGKDPRTPIERLAAEWLEVRARFLGQLAGLSDERFNGPMEEGPVDVPGGGGAPGRARAARAEDDAQGRRAALRRG